MWSWLYSWLAHALSCCRCLYACFFAFDKIFHLANSFPIYVCIEQILVQLLSYTNSLFLIVSKWILLPTLRSGEKIFPCWTTLQKHALFVWTTFNTAHIEMQSAVVYSQSNGKDGREARSYLSKKWLFHPLVTVVLFATSPLYCLITVDQTI